jgi:hypothetical protein
MLTILKYYNFVIDFRYCNDMTESTYMSTNSVNVIIRRTFESLLLNALIKYMPSVLYGLSTI